MARLKPILQADASSELKAAFESHVREYQGRITNMKATLGHSIVAFEVYMQWYPLYREIEKIIGTRLAYLYAFAISNASNCPLCSTFFRKIIIEAGEKPEQLVLSAQEQLLLDFGSAIAQFQGNIPDDLYDEVSERFDSRELVLLIAFAGQMIATNVFNNVIETDIDEYLLPYSSSITTH